MESSTYSREFGEPKVNRLRLAALIVGLLAGPLAYLLSLELGYATSYFTCGVPRLWLVHALTLLPLTLIGLAAWWVIRAHPRPFDADARDWPHWLAQVSLISLAFSGLSVLVNDIHLNVLVPCQ